MNKPFFSRVYQLVSRIPSGRVATYGDLAWMLGLPQGARVVGWAMRYCPEGYPWHRVVNAQGRLRTSERLPDGKLLQQALLEEEGVIFAAPGRIDLERYIWSEEHRG